MKAAGEQLSAALTQAREKLGPVLDELMGEYQKATAKPSAKVTKAPFHERWEDFEKWLDDTRKTDELLTPAQFLNAYAHTVLGENNFVYVHGQDLVNLLDFHFDRQPAGSRYMTVTKPGDVVFPVGAPIMVTKMEIISSLPNLSWKLSADGSAGLSVTAHGFQAVYRPKDNR
jgi:hypothetical protein